jgi:hypothetical protein
VSGHRFAYLLCALALALLPFAASAAPIYKCRAPDGALSYQDSPCPEGTDQPAPKIAPPPPYVPPEPELAGRREPPKQLGDFQPVREPPPPPPTLYRCYDGVTGKAHVTDTPQQNLRYVPLWTVLPSAGYFGAVTADVRGGMAPSGGGVSAGAYGQYTAVEDQCRQLTLAGMCRYWSEHVDEVSSQRRLAFKDRPRGTRAGGVRAPRPARNPLRPLAAVRNRGP